MKKTIKYERISNEEAKKRYPIIYNTIKSIYFNIDDNVLGRIISLIVDICPYCYEENRRCQCWNDD